MTATRCKPEPLTDEQHRRLVALAFPDDDGAVDRHRVEHSPHRLDGRLVGLVAVALPHRVRARDRRLLDDAEELEREIGAHRLTSGAAGVSAPAAGSSQRVGLSSRNPST